jgi:hypothetical protein
MRRHRINRNFTKPEAIGPIIFSLSSLEQVVKALNISPEEYESSLELKEWVRRNKEHKYVPSELPEAYGFPLRSCNKTYPVACCVVALGVVKQRGTLVSKSKRESGAERIGH